MDAGRFDGGRRGRIPVANNRCSSGRMVQTPLPGFRVKTQIKPPLPDLCEDWSQIQRTPLNCNDRFPDIVCGEIPFRQFAFDADVRFVFSRFLFPKNGSGKEGSIRRKKLPIAYRTNLNHQGFSYPFVIMSFIKSGKRRRRWS